MKKRKNSAFVEESPLPGTTMHAPHVAVAVIGVVHIGIMLLELGPGYPPFVMQRVLDMWKRKGKLVTEFSKDQTRLVVAIVRNAGVYNGVVGAGLIASAFLGYDGFVAQATLLVGVIAAGLIGMTLSPATIVQSLLGAGGLVWLIITRPDVS
jgi:uncharacterized membrane protein